MQEIDLVTLLTNATALSILAGVLYFSFRLLDRAVDIVTKHSERLDALLARLAEDLAEGKK